MRSFISRSHHRIAGALAAALALAVGELMAGIFPASVSLTEAVGGLAIDYVPPPIKDFAIAVFGIYDKLALIIGMVVVTVLLGALVGKRAARRWSVAVWVFGLFGLVGAFSLQREPDMGWLSSLIYAAVAAAVALLALRVLFRWLPAAGAETGDISPVDMGVEGDEHAADEMDPSEAAPESEPEISRRKFLVGAGAVFGVAIAAAAGGRMLLERTKQALAGREDVVLPQATETTTTTGPPTTAAAGPSTTEAAAAGVEST
ncbi:MAG: hypothetical protein F4196_09385, partial [Acidimicrobiia bacterium]|nr:hypothetical protein [Acidimicrobiia bacterium]